MKNKKRTLHIVLLLIALNVLTIFLVNRHFDTRSRNVEQSSVMGNSQTENAIVPNIINWSQRVLRYLNPSG